MDPSDLDVWHMRRALELAAGGRGLVEGWGCGRAVGGVGRRVRTWAHGPWTHGPWLGYFSDLWALGPLGGGPFGAGPIGALSVSKDRITVPALPKEET